MIAWAKDPEKGLGIFQWDEIIRDDPTEFTASKIIHP